MQSEIPVRCPYCRKLAVLISSKFIYGCDHGMVWACLDCDAYVGTHKGGSRHLRPLGSLANKELRGLRALAHKHFDALWQDGLMSRQEAYKLLRKKMHLNRQQAHIAKFSVEQCLQLLEILRAMERTA